VRMKDGSFCIDVEGWNRFCVSGGLLRLGA
jgi:hypothetical protein